MRTNRMVGVVSVVGIAVIVLAPAAFAQGMKWRGSGGWGPGTAYGRIYDPKTVETVSGEVVKVDRITPMRGMSSGVHLVVKTDKGDVSVQLGPQWYLENQDVKIQPKDKVEVKGSRVTVQGQPALIAAEVKKGDEVLKLRDEAGIPMWAGWRRG
ncbi:MAG TPA: DNA-binding protein [Methylomirabilota bacterium]|nr:DNA-binding protein [Methylomirabilota bacterium]